MKTIALLIMLILAMSFGLSQRDSFAQQLPSINPNNVVTINGTSIEIHYDITRGQLLSTNADDKSKSLVFILQPTGDGKLTVKLPRTLIGAQINDVDTHFTVYLDNHGINYDEVQSFRYRILSIPFHGDSKKITITGTQISLQNTTQTQNTNLNMHNDTKQVTIKVPFTTNPPVIDGKWTAKDEWYTTEAVTVEHNKTKMYIIAEQDQNFVYVMSDIVTDQVTQSDANLVQIGMTMIFDMDNYTGDSLNGKDIEIKTGKLFINGTEIKSHGSEVSTFDEQGNFIALATPLGYNSGMNMSSTNDPFDSVHPHQVYEFKIPKSLLHSETKYGFFLDAYTCLGNEVNLCRSNDIWWPSNAIQHIPLTHGFFELTSETNHTRISESISLVEIIIVVAIAVSVAAIYLIKIKKHRL
jgi:hypothetical protein